LCQTVFPKTSRPRTAHTAENAVPSAKIVTTPAEASGSAPGRGRLAGRRVLVVGAGTRPSPEPDPPLGNGRAISVLAAREGAAVACADRDADAAEATAALVRDEGQAAAVVLADVAAADACASVVADSAAALGGLDGLVLNVGIGVVRAELDVDAGQRDRRQFRVDADAGRGQHCRETYSHVHGLAGAAEPVQPVAQPGQGLRVCLLVAGLQGQRGRPTGEVRAAPGVAELTVAVGGVRQGPRLLADVTRLGRDAMGRQGVLDAALLGQRRAPR